jgi:hypothetical protein
MTDHTNDPTPPPERPLPDDARARIRADLLQQAHQHRSTSRWLVPAGAAAAVALVAGMGYWAISPGGQPQHGAPATDGGASSGPVVAPDGTLAPAPVPATGTAAPVGPDGPLPSSVPSAGSVPPSEGPVPDSLCANGLENVLPGATLAFQEDDFSFYVKGDRFVLCDNLGGSTTVHHAMPLTPRTNDLSTYDVSTIYTGQQVVRVAGGIVPEGAPAFDVTYTFPDGHAEHAGTATDAVGRTWWYMSYSYPDPGGNELKQPEIRVTVSLSGVQEHYSLQYGVNTCAQANHGC